MNWFDRMKSGVLSRIKREITEGLWAKLGVSFDEVHTSANSRFWSATHDYSPSELARREAWLPNVLAFAIL